MKKQTPVFFYGGAFDPLTRAHISILRNLLEKPGRVICGVTEVSPHKQHQPIAPLLHRMECIRMEFPDAWDSQKLEIVPQSKRTWEFLSDHPDWRVTHIVMGEDEKQSLERGEWHFSEKILENYQIEIVPRPEGAISSSRVRETMRELYSYISPKTLPTLLKVPGYWKEEEEECQRNQKLPPSTFL